MRRGIVEQRDGVRPRGHHLAATHDDGPERAAALGNALLGERDRQLHKFVFRTVHVFDL